jgi:hypothetical protein
MAQCPDCYSVKIRLGTDEGDGKCSVCRGEGRELGLTEIVDVALGNRTPCWACGFSGKCQTCRGSGVVKDVRASEDHKEEPYSDVHDNPHEHESWPEYTPNYSPPLPQRSLGCIFVGGCLIVIFGIPFLLGADFPGITQVEQRECITAGSSFVLAGIIMVIFGFVPHTPGEGFFLFLALALIFLVINVCVSVLVT